MKNFVANIPIYVGLVFRKISDALFNFSFQLHITFKTEAGLKLAEINKAFATMKDVLKTQAAQQTAAVQKQEVQNRKLVNILNGDDNNDKPVLSSFSRKPSKLDN